MSWYVDCSNICTGDNRKLIFGTNIRSSLSDNDRSLIPSAIQGLLNYIEENSKLVINQLYILSLMLMQYYLVLDIPKVFLQKLDAHSSEADKLKRSLEEGVF